MYKPIENGVVHLSKKLLSLNIGLVILVLFAISLDHMGYLGTNLSFRAVKGIGKEFGTITIIIAVIAFMNYVLREIYLQIIRNKIALSQTMNRLYKNLMKDVRLLHPLVGTVAIYAGILHVYFVWFRGVHNFNLSIAFGILALLLLLFLLYIGHKIRCMPQNKKLRTIHKMIAYLFLVFYVLHIAIKGD
jgi:hypothetical protein